MVPVTIIIATAGRDSIQGTFRSLALKRHVHDRVEVFVDGIIPTAVREAWVTAQLPGRLTCLQDGPHHDWGHTPRNMALAEVRDGYVYHLDDDDITLPETLSVIREEIGLHPGAFFFFRVVYPDECTFSWREHRVERGWVGTGIFVHPAGIPLGRFGPTYDGDFDFIDETLRLNPDRPVVWVDRVIGVIEPHRWTQSYEKYVTTETRGRHIILRGNGHRGAITRHHAANGDRSGECAPHVTVRDVALEERQLASKAGCPQQAIILSSYLTAQADHHHGCQFPSDAPELLLLAKTAERKGVECIIFYDALSERFVREHMSSHVTFVKVPPPERISNNDYRLFLYRDWLSWHQYESVWCSDLFDVRLNRNPTALLDGEHELWIGTHRDWTISESSEVGRWMLKHFVRVYSEVPEIVRDKPVLMAGTFGGYYEPVSRFLNLLTAEHERHNSDDRNFNMPMFNLVAYRDLKPEKVWAKGAPLHSKFWAYDIHADVCFVHK